jgi:hypothetical protein
MKLLNQMRRSNFRLKNFYIHNFKAWIDTLKEISVAAIGGNARWLSFKSFRLFVDEEIRSDLNPIFARKVKVPQITRFNRIIYSLLKNELILENEHFWNQLYGEIFIPMNRLIIFYISCLFRKKTSIILLWCSFASWRSQAWLLLAMEWFESRSKRNIWKGS